MKEKILCFNADGFTKKIKEENRPAYWHCLSLSDSPTPVLVLGLVASLSAYYNVFIHPKINK